MQLIKDRQLRRFETDPFHDVVQVDQSPAYELLCSLLVLYAPRIYQGFRQWAATTRKELPKGLYDEGRPFFQGIETCVGFGVIRMVPDLRKKTPEALIEAIRAADPVKVALYMLEGPGSLEPARLEALERLLGGGATPAKVGAALRGFSSARKERSAEIVASPERERKQLARFLERYQEAVFARQAAKLKAPLDEAVRRANDTLALLPTSDAIERLTGGYTLSTDLPLKRITLAPSVFLYPAVACRVDEQAGEAFILYGIKSSFVEVGEPVSGTFIGALRALADPNRVQILKLASEKPRLAPEIVELLGLSQPTVHHHIRELWLAELIRQERTRQGMLCTVRLDGLNRVIGSLVQLAEAAEATQSRRSVSSTSVARGGG